MNCLTPEQLAQLALGFENETPLWTHVDGCEACQAALDNVRRLGDQLNLAHAELNRGHDAGRTLLMASLSIVERPVRSDGVWQRITSNLEGLSMRQRITVGGVGLSTVVSIVLICLTLNSGAELSAMERMVRAVRAVTSYSFRQLNNTTYPAQDGKPHTVRHEAGFVCWRAPGPADQQWFGDLHAEVKSWRDTDAELEKLQQGEPREPKLTLHIEETHPVGKSGIVIVYTENLYFRCPPLAAEEMPADNSMAKLRALREGSGEIIRDLGTLQIDGRDAHGYVVDFRDAVPFRGFGPVEVWVDPATDLPIEFSYQWRDDDKEGFIDEYRVTDCRWNIVLEDKLFDVTPPEGLIDTTPVGKDSDVAPMISAMQLYADLSGGHYPQLTRFNAEAVHAEMLKLAGFDGLPQAAWQKNEKFQEIQQSAAALEWLERFLLAKFRAGYYGEKIGPQDRDQVLMWWMLIADDGYRVFYGDLRTEVIDEKRFIELLPKEAERLLP